MNLGQMQQAAMNQYGVTKDPSVSNVKEAEMALRKRADELRNKLSCVESWKQELATIDRMLAAYAGQ